MRNSTSKINGDALSIGDNDFTMRNELINRRMTNSMPEHNEWLIIAATVVRFRSSGGKKKIRLSRSRTADNLSLFHSPTSPSFPSQTQFVN